MEELLSSFIVALGAVIQDEETAIGQVSPEEWDDIRPSKYMRRSTLLNILNVSTSEIIWYLTCTVKQSNRSATEIGEILQINPTRCTILLSTFISLLYMFRTTMCPPSGEITVSMRHWYLSLCMGCVWSVGLSFTLTSRPDATHTE